MFRESGKCVRRLLASLAVVVCGWSSVEAQGLDQVVLSGRSLYVSPAGAATNDGSLARPLSLAAALSAASPARPGDVIWLRGGTYRGTFISAVAGTATSPIIVRQYPGERATIDSAPNRVDALYVNGAHTWFWGFEIMNSDPLRVAAQPSGAEIRRGSGAVANAPGVRFINMIVHDTLNGIELWASAPDGEVYGSLIYHNGYDAPDRGHGHGIYTQNRTGVRLIRENILFRGYSHNIHAYGSDAAWLNNIELRGNVSFDAGGLSAYRDRNLLLGGGSVASNPTVVENFTYYSPGRSGGENNLGLAAGCTNLRMEWNYFAHFQAYPLTLARCPGTIANNKLLGFVADEQMAQYPANTYSTAVPSGVDVFVRRNAYESGRANIVIYNWRQDSAVSVDLAAAGLSMGQGFEIRDAQNFFGPVVVQGTYQGQPLMLPMTGLTGEPAIGAQPRSAPAHTPAQFGVFVLLPTGTPQAPAPPRATVQSFTGAPATITQGQSSVLSWTGVGSRATLSPGVGSVPVTGSVTVSPSSTTLYELTVFDEQGRSDWKSFELLVTPVNKAPTATLSQPGSALNLTVGTDLVLTANGADADGQVVNTAIYAGSTLLVSSNGPTATMTWRVPAGVHRLTARVVDDKGAAATSGEVVVTATEAPAATLPPPPPPPVGGADLAITQSIARGQIVLRSDAVYTIVVANNGSGAATAVKVTNALPWRTWFMSIASSQGTCNADAVCTLGTLPPGGQAVITLVVQPKGVGDFTNVATVTSTTVDPQPANNKSTSPAVTVVY